MFKKIKNEPTIFLFRKMWRFSEGNRKKVVLFMILSTCSNLIILIEPIVLAKIFNEIQFNGINSENIKFLLLMTSSFIWIALIFWLFHASSRILERRNCFMVRKNYKEYLLEKVLNLDLNWHSDRDSGDTIDKINKASLGLYNFSGNIFQITRIIVQIIGITFALIYFDYRMALLHNSFQI